MKTIIANTLSSVKGCSTVAFNEVYEKYAGSINGLVLQQVKQDKAMADRITARVFVQLYADMQVQTTGFPPTFNIVFSVLLKILQEDGRQFEKPAMTISSMPIALSPVPARVFWAI